jgi:hypothetical protein
MLTITRVTSLHKRHFLRGLSSVENYELGENYFTVNSDAIIASNVI